MTLEQWMDLKARTEALLATELKEYKSLSKIYDEHVEALSEWTMSQSDVDVFRRGEPRVYMERLRYVLKRVKDITNYPRLITKEQPAKALYIAAVPITNAAQIPGLHPAEPIAPPETPDAWNRYMNFNSYKENLSPELQKEGEDLITWFANRRRLHDYAKNLVRAGADNDAVEKTVKELDAQNDQIEAYFDRVQACMTGGEQLIKNKYEDAKPSGNFTKAEIEEMQQFNPVCAALSKEKRVETNRKFISRKDLKKPKDPEELSLRMRELQEWHIPIPVIGEEEEKDSDNE